MYKSIKVQSLIQIPNGFVEREKGRYYTFMGKKYIPLVFVSEEESSSDEFNFYLLKNDSENLQNTKVNQNYINSLLSVKSDFSKKHLTSVALVNVKDYSDLINLSTRKTLVKISKDESDIENIEVVYMSSKEKKEEESFSKKDLILNTEKITVNDLIVKMSNQGVERDDIKSLVSKLEYYDVFDEVNTEDVKDFSEILNIKIK